MVYVITNLMDFRQHHSNQIIIPHGLGTSYGHALPVSGTGSMLSSRVFLSEHADHVVVSLFESRPSLHPLFSLFDGICSFLLPIDRLSPSYM